MNSEQQKNARFWDRMAARYSRSKIGDMPSYEQKLEKTRALFDTDTRVFEFGCGTGSTALEHARHVEHIYATDISAKMIEIAQQKALDANINNVQFEQMAIEEIDLPDASIDVAMAMSIIHLLTDRTTAFNTVHRLLKPRGVFVSSTACLADTQSYFKFILPLAKAVGQAPYCAFFKKDELVAEIEAAGFTTNEVWQPGKGKAVFIVATKK